MGNLLVVDSAGGSILVVTTVLIVLFIYLDISQQQNLILLSIIFLYSIYNVSQTCYGFNKHELDFLFNMFPFHFLVCSNICFRQSKRDILKKQQQPVNIIMYKNVQLYSSTFYGIVFTSISFSLTSLTSRNTCEKLNRQRSGRQLQSSYLR